MYVRSTHEFPKLISFELSDKLHWAKPNNAQNRGAEQFNII